MNLACRCNQSSMIRSAVSAVLCLLTVRASAQTFAVQKVFADQEEQTVTQGIVVAPAGFPLSSATNNFGNPFLTFSGNVLDHTFDPVTGNLYVLTDQPGSIGFGTTAMYEYTAASGYTESSEIFTYNPDGPDSDGWGTDDDLAVYNGIPEPSTLTLFSIAGLGVLVSRLSRRKR